MGIGGFGMSAIARVLLGTGYTVSGCDQRDNDLSVALSHDGAMIYQGHDPSHIHDIDLLLASSAIPDDHPELQAARANDVPVMRRRDAIGLLTADYRTIAISGTHGKTTTTALLSHVLTEANLDPTTIVGGVINNLGANARVGRSGIFVIEADEYGEMFLGLRPAIAAITNLEYDHPDMFPSMEALTATFEQFIECIQPDGTLVACLDSPAVASFAENRQWSGLPTITYAVNDIEADWFAQDIQPIGQGRTQFSVHFNGTILGTATLNLVGTYNVQNALATLAIANELGVPFEVVAPILETFTGTGRRSEIMGNIGEVTVVNDYAHHPTAIQAVLSAWAQQTSGRLWGVWQPHTYNRLRALSKEFIHAFTAADHVLITDVYSVRETITAGLTAPDLAAKITEIGHPSARYSGNFESTATILADEVQAGDCVVIMSAGDAPKIGEILLQSLANREA